LTDVEFSGTTKSATDEGTVEIRIPTLKGFKRWRSVGVTQGSTWSAQLTNLPVGGPYTLDFRVRDGRGITRDNGTISSVFVGDLWILAGQSNMYGYANLTHEVLPHPKVMAYMIDNTWQLARDPMHRQDGSNYLAYAPAATSTKEALEYLVATKGSSLGLPFAKELVNATGRPIGLIPCALGGTTMDQWGADLKDKGGDSMYGAMLERFRATGSHVRGILWYQGESDASPPELADAFKEKFLRFVEEVRRDFDAPRLPFYYVQIGRVAVPSEDNSWNKIQWAQLECERLMAPGAMVPAVDLELDDNVHLGGRALQTLGQRLAKIVLSDLYGGPEMEVGPRPEKAVWNVTPKGEQIRVTFGQVNGRLQCDGRVNGFSLCDAEGRALGLIYKQEIAQDSEDTVILWVTYFPELGYDVPKDSGVFYGLGRDPYCNLTDDQNMGVPVFGPLAITWPST
jgi:sialate O-acetylesterase